MEACQAVEREVDKVLARFSELDRSSQTQLDQLLTRLDNISASMPSGDDDIDDTSGFTVAAATVVKLHELLSEVHTASARISAAHRDLHGAVSRVGKAIDKHFTHDTSAAAIDPAFLNDARRQRLANAVIHRHLQHVGQPDLSAQLAAVSELPSEAMCDEPDTLEHHVIIRQIVDSVLERRLESAVAWIEHHAGQLQDMHSLLEFRVRRLRFLTLLQQSRPCDAIHEARVHLSGFCATYDQRHVEDGAVCLMDELRRLMGALAFVHVGMQRSPYAQLVSDAEWLDVAELFTRDACRVLGVSADSPLLVLVNAGCKAVPALMSMRQVMHQRQVGGTWSAADDLPIEVDVDREYRYHSVFACPILKQQSTEVNPPMRLICGHCISKDALHRLSHGSKLKCPYCPIEMNASDAKMVFF